MWTLTTLAFQCENEHLVHWISCAGGGFDSKIPCTPPMCCHNFCLLEKTTLQTAHSVLSLHTNTLWVARCLLKFLFSFITFSHTGHVKPSIFFFTVQCLIAEGYCANNFLHSGQGNNLGLNLFSAFECSPPATTSQLLSTSSLPQFWGFIAVLINSLRINLTISWASSASSLLSSASPCLTMENLFAAREKISSGSSLEFSTTFAYLELRRGHCLSRHLALKEKGDYFYA